MIKHKPVWSEVPRTDIGTEYETSYSTVDAALEYLTLAHGQRIHVLWRSKYFAEVTLQYEYRIQWYIWDTQRPSSISRRWGSVV